MGQVKHYLVYGGKSSNDFNVWISGSGTYDAPERDVTTISVPGRSGDLTMDNGRYKNIEMTYPAFISRNFKENMAAFRAYMKSMTGYRRLEDTYHPEFYYEAILTEGFDIKTTALNRAGEFEIIFNRKPQRWLKSGEEWTAVSYGDSVLYNPTMFDAKPVIRVRGNGTIYVGTETIQISDNTTYIDIDTELQDCYYGLNNLNSCVELSSGDFPVFKPGYNNIRKGTVTSYQVKPRWWTL